jgi:hypothetical protein
VKAGVKVMSAVEFSLAAWGSLARAAAFAIEPPDDAGWT